MALFCIGGQRGTKLEICRWLIRPTVEEDCCVTVTAVCGTSLENRISLNLKHSSTSHNSFAWGYSLIREQSFLHCNRRFFWVHYLQYSNMVAKTKLNDDYVGALLRVQGVPNDVVNNLLKTNYCNVEGLRTLLGQSQAKCAKKVGINVDLLDGLPHKVSLIPMIHIYFCTVLHRNFCSSCWWRQSLVLAVSVFDSLKLIDYMNLSSQFAWIQCLYRPSS